MPTRRATYDEIGSSYEDYARGATLKRAERLLKQRGAALAGLPRELHRQRRSHGDAGRESDLKRARPYGSMAPCSSAMPPRNRGRGSTSCSARRSGRKPPGSTSSGHTSKTARAHFIFGEPSECVEQIHRYAEIGVGHLACMMGFAVRDVSVVERSLDLFADRVLPHFR